MKNIDVDFASQKRPCPLNNNLLGLVLCYFNIYLHFLMNYLAPTLELWHRNHWVSELKKKIEFKLTIRTSSS